MSKNMQEVVDQLSINVKTLALSRNEGKNSKSSAWPFNQLILLPILTEAAEKPKEIENSEATTTANIDITTGRLDINSYLNKSLEEILDLKVDKN